MSGDRNLPSGPSDWARLIGAVGGRGDRQAFAQLFEHFAPRVKTFMRRSGMSEAVAEELAQETLITVWRKAALFDPASTGPAAWVFTIARNLRIDAQRRDRRSGAHAMSDIDAEFALDKSPRADGWFPGSTRSPCSRSDGEAARSQLRVVELSFHGEMAHAEIANELQIPLGTVKSRLRLAMNKLHDMLDEML